MKLGFSTLACPNWTAEEMAAQAAECGYDGAELSPRHQPSNFAPSLAPEDRRRLRQLFARHNLEIAMVNAYSDFIEAEPAVRAANVAGVKEFVDLARDLGAPRVRVFGQNAAKALPPEIPRERCLDYVAAAISEIADYAADDGIEILLETHDVFCEPDLVRELTSRTTAANFGVIWDLANSLSTGKTVEQAFAAVQDHLRFVQLKDYVNTTRLEGPCLIGAGDAPIAAALALVASIGFDGYVSLETEKMYHPEPTVPDAAESFPEFIRYMAASGH